MNENRPERMVQTSVRIRERVWRALRDLAAERALRVGGKPSASATLEDLVEAAVASKAAAREEHARE